MVSFRQIDDANREAVEASDVSPTQQQFVSNAADSIREAAEEPDGRALYWAIDADETPARYGFKQTGEIVFDNEVLLQLNLR